MDDIELYFKGEPIAHLVLEQQIVKKIRDGKDVWIAGRKSARINGRKVPVKTANRIAQAYAALHPERHKLAQ